MCLYYTPYSTCKYKDNHFNKKQNVIVDIMYVAVITLFIGQAIRHIRPVGDCYSMYVTICEGG